MSFWGVPPSLRSLVGGCFGRLRGYGKVGVRAAPVATSVVVTPNTIAIGLSQTQTLTAQVLDQYGQDMGLSVTWSSNSGNATVNASSGLVTPVSYGAATITATYNALTGTCGVTVQQPTQLSFIQQPAGAVDGSAFSTQPIVALLDSLGNTVAESGRAVTLANAMGSATISGNGPLNTNSAGQAVFTGVTESGATGSHSLTASCPGLTGATSNAFTVTAGGSAADPTQLPASKPGSTGTAAVVVSGLAAQSAGYTYNDPTSAVLILKCTDTSFPSAGNHCTSYPTGGPHVSQPWQSGGKTYYTFGTGEGGAGYFVDVCYDDMTVGNGRVMAGTTGETNYAFSCDPSFPRIVYLKTADKTFRRYDTGLNAFADTTGWPWVISAAGTTAQWFQTQINDTWFACKLESNGTLVAYRPSTQTEINATFSRAGWSSAGTVDELHLDLQDPYVYWSVSGADDDANLPWRLDTDTVTARAAWTATMAGGFTCSDDHNTPVRGGTAGAGFEGTPWGGVYMQTYTGTITRPFVGDNAYHNGNADWYNSGYCNILGFQGAASNQWMVSDRFINDASADAIRVGTIHYVPLGGGTMRFICSSQCPQPGGDYFQYTRSVPSPDGKLVFWTSNMNSSGQYQVFCAKIPTG